MIRGEQFLQARILIVDDQEVNLRLLELILRREGLSNFRSVQDPYQVISSYVEFQPDIILLDLLMPGMDGFAVMELLRRRIPNGVFLPVLVLTADSLPETRRRALALGAKDFLTKPFDPIEVMLRIWNLLETRFLYLRLEQQNEQLGVQVQRSLRELDEAQTEVIWRLTRAAESRDEDTGLHTQRVARLAALIARTLGLGEEQIELIRRAAPLHDIGKVAVPDQILRKPGRLTPEEFEQIKQHTDFGGRLLAGSRLPLLQVAQEIALHHHERWDGTGYPQALKSTAIPIAARIVAVADAFDALTHERPYKPAWSIADAVEELLACAGTRYDPQIVDALVQVLFAEGQYRPLQTLPQL
ncbi:response regulator [Candidatus Gracilibacteria bacterium]|nr:response regulator [Candidatus Gracilibacteria bacterium]